MVQPKILWLLYDKYDLSIEVKNTFLFPKRTMNYCIKSKNFFRNFLLINGMIMQFSIFKIIVSGNGDAVASIRITNNIRPRT